jgi:hypothetical protein
MQLQPASIKHLAVQSTLAVTQPIGSRSSCRSTHACKGIAYESGGLPIGLAALPEVTMYLAMSNAKIALAMSSMMQYL